MPLSSLAAYLPTMQAFIDHWTQVNASLGASPLTLPGAYNLAALQADYAALQAANIAVIDGDNDRQMASGNRDLAKAALLTKLAQFRGAVKSALDGTGVSNALPRTPNFSSVESRFLAPFDDMANAWGKINALSGIPTFTPPLTLGAITLANFNTELAAMRALFASVSAASNEARIARRNRDALLTPIRTRLKQYRNAVVGQFGPAHAFALSLPALSPPPGSTPDPVSVSGLWNAANAEADLTWTPSENSKLDYYSVRSAPGPTYKTDEESVVAQVDKTLTTYSTDVGLVAPGSVALFKVYVVLTTGNEKGSATVKITRPG